MAANRPEAIEMMKKFYAQGGVSISETSTKKEFDTRPTFDLPWPSSSSSACRPTPSCMASPTGRSRPPASFTFPRHLVGRKTQKTQKTLEDFP